MKFPRGGGRAWTIAWFALAHLLLITIGFHLIYTSRYSDFPIYQRYGQHVVLGQLPYESFAAEYPPLAFLFFTLPAATVGFSSLTAYYAAWLVQIFLADVAALWTLDGIARRRGQSPMLVLGAYTALFAVVGPITERDFDMFPALMTLLAIGAFEAEREVRGWIRLSLGVMTKLYPILLAPVVLLRHGGKLSPRAALRGAAIGLATCVAVMLPWLLTAPASLLSFLRYHAERGLQLESTYASVVLAATRLHLTRSVTVNSFGSWNVIGPAAEVATRASTWLLLVGLAVAYAVCSAGFARRAPTTRTADSNATLASCGALVLLAGMITSKVLSPQYQVWLLPLLALSTGPRRTLRWVLFAAIAITTYYIFPRHYNALIAIQPAAVVALLARNLMLVLLTVLLAIDILRERRGAHAARSA
ncbi:MAG TPA: glycosyltransferase 87 family protein [Gemmatimonadaceae bacterium]|nr:glycosyltransferase 87 family protein [Gemmatimonadaceae bacterium]